MNIPDKMPPHPEQAGYQKQEWVDGVTPVDAAHMTHLEEGLALVFGAKCVGVVDYTGAIFAGSGFTVTRTATGSYLVNLTLWGSGQFVPLVTIWGANHIVGAWQNDAYSFAVSIVNMAGAPADCPFSFVVFDAAGMPGMFHAAEIPPLI
jgi:hypothetical protein